MKKFYFFSFLALFLVTAVKAQELVSSTPAQGSVIHKLPTKVQLVMNQDINLDRSSFSIYLLKFSGDDAVDVARAFFDNTRDFDLWADTGIIEQESQGNTITLGLLNNLPAGVYVIKWWVYEKTAVRKGVSKGFSYFSYQPHGDMQAMEHHDETSMAAEGSMHHDNMHHDEVPMLNKPQIMEHHHDENNMATDKNHDMQQEHHHGNVESLKPISVSMNVFNDSRGYKVRIIPDGLKFTPQNASLAHVDGEGHAHIYVNGHKVARVYTPWFHLDDKYFSVGENTVKVTLNANDHSNYTYTNKLVEASQVVNVAKMPIDMHHEDNHSTVNSSKSMSVSIEVNQDPKSGYNVKIIPEGLKFLPGNAGRVHTDGEGHAAIYVNGHKVARVYGFWFHLNEDLFTAGENQIRVTLNTNDHSDYTFNGELVEATSTVNIAANMEAMGNEQGMHDRTNATADHHQSRAGANTFTISNGVAVLEPLLDISGVFKLALYAQEEAYLQLSVTSPSGVEKLLNIQSDVAVFDLDSFEEGVWKILAMVGSDWIETEILALKQLSDFDSEIVLFLTPKPNITQVNQTEAFVYAFADGENLHKRYVLKHNMQGASISIDDTGIELVHNHFMDRYNTEGFIPKANNATINFPQSGIWNVDVTLMGGFNETATFQVEIE